VLRSRVGGPYAESGGPRISTKPAESIRSHRCEAGGRRALPELRADQRPPVAVSFDNVRGKPDVTDGHDGVPGAMRFESHGHRHDDYDT